MEHPICYQYLERCAKRNTASSVQSKNDHMAVKADLIVLTDVKAIPVLLNLASTFDTSKGECSNRSLHPAFPLYVIPSSYKVGCTPMSGSTVDCKGSSERLNFLKWCHTVLKGVTVFNPSIKYCQSAYLQGLAASLSDQNVIISSEIFTAGFNGLGVLTLQDSVPNCERLLLGKSVTVSTKKIVGIEIVGELQNVTVSTDIVLQFIRFLKPLSDCFVEVWGRSLHLISISDRITISNMVKETCVHCIFFPCDETCADFLKSVSELLFSHRKIIISKAPVNIKIPRSYDENLVFDLSLVETAISGPKRCSDRIRVNNLKFDFQASLYNKFSPNSFGLKISAENDEIKHLHGSIVGLSIAGCTNSSNAFVTLQTGILAESLIKLGCSLPEYVQGSHVMGSGLAKLYLDEAGLSNILEQFGLKSNAKCCIDTSLNNAIQSQFSKNVVTCGLLSGNGNYENRKFPGATANYLMSSPLALLLATAGRIDVDLGQILLHSGEMVKLGDIWPQRAELINFECQEVLPKVCARVFKDFTKFNPYFEAITHSLNEAYPWNTSSLYILRPPYLEMQSVLGDINDGRVLLSLGDNISSEIISPSGSLSRTSTAANYLGSKGLAPREYDSYGNRRGNHNIVAMGIFNNTKLQNNLVSMKGPYTRHIPSNTIVDIYEAARLYKKQATPTLVVAGSNYGCGPTRDSGARGLRLLGVSAVIARSFDNNHRSELINLGIMPVRCDDADCIDPLCLVSLTWPEEITVNCEGRLSWECDSSPERCVAGAYTSVGCNGSVKVMLAVTSPDELEMLRCGGLLQTRIKELRDREFGDKGIGVYSTPLPPIVPSHAPPHTTNYNIQNHGGTAHAVSCMNPGQIQYVVNPTPMNYNTPIPNYGNPNYPNLLHWVPVIQYLPANLHQQSKIYFPPH